MQKHKLYLQMLDYTVVNNYGMFQTYLHLREKRHILPSKNLMNCWFRSTLGVKLWANKRILVYFIQTRAG